MHSSLPSLVISRVSVSLRSLDLLVTRVHLTGTSRYALVANQPLRSISLSAHSTSWLCFLTIHLSQQSGSSCFMACYPSSFLGF